MDAAGLSLGDTGTGYRVAWSDRRHGHGERQLGAGSDPAAGLCPAALPAGGREPVVRRDGERPPGGQEPPGAGGPHRRRHPSPGLLSAAPRLGPAGWQQRLSRSPFSPSFSACCWWPWPTGWPAQVFGPTGGAAGRLPGRHLALQPVVLPRSADVHPGGGPGHGPAAGVVLPSLVGRRAIAVPPGLAWRSMPCCGALGLWALYYFAFLLVAVNLMVGVWWLAGRRRRRAGWAWLGRWALAQGAVLLLYAPWIPIAWRQAIEPAGAALARVHRAGRSVGPDLVGAEPGSVGRRGPGVAGPVPVRRAVRPGPGRPAAGPSALRGSLPQRRRAALVPGGGGVPARAADLSWPPLSPPCTTCATPLPTRRPSTSIVAAGTGLALRSRWRAAGLARLAGDRRSSRVSRSVPTTPTSTMPADDHRAATRFLAERWRPGDAILVNAGLRLHRTADLLGWRSHRLARPAGRLPGDRSGRGCP